MKTKQKIDYYIINSCNKTASEEAYDRGFFEISEFLIGNESVTEDSKSMDGSIIEENLNDKELEDEFKDTGLLEKMEEIEKELVKDEKKENEEK